ncbi:acetyltransferase [Bacillus paralicheniformis]|uniref:acetyltransferase n=1 Tax=Bacillus TaxID=1386 RepID=UPI0003A3DD2E|nr:acetyltransferase [Bacillus paralicheniformis]MSN98920.1 acetyltransferase [Bacillus paralicheniformis]MSO02928.1 acetyltransferase [Bacillus paralicheniformis]MSO06921.1 acetyltransferase [Bacillus paralicheniformis]MSO10915.1 acetyltransferase [Bacillus paralicheniformis]NJE36000.1 acetyltransferase [Bacillus paralicheniformis]
MQNVVIIGAGGHGKVVRDLVIARPDTALAGILDDRYAELHVENGLYRGPSGAAEELARLHPDAKFVLAVGQNGIRKRLYERLGLPLDRYAVLIHPSAVISGSARIQNGAVVMASSVIQADAHIGIHTIVNTGAIVEHDNRIGDYVHLSPGTVLTGGVTVMEGAHLGAGTAVIPGKTIGRWSVTGAGSSVIHDIPDDCTAVGVPARKIKYHSSKKGEKHESE